MYVPPPPLCYSSTHPLPLHMALRYFHFLNVMFTFKLFCSLHPFSTQCNTTPLQNWTQSMLRYVCTCIAPHSISYNSSNCSMSSIYVQKWYRIWWNAWPNLQQSVGMAALSSSSQHCLLSLQKDTVAILAIFRIVKSAKRTRGEHKQCDRYVMTPFEFQSLGGICVTANNATEHTISYRELHYNRYKLQLYTVMWWYLAPVQAAGILQAYVLFTASIMLVSFLLQMVRLTASPVNACTIFSPLKPWNAAAVHSDFPSCKLGTVQVHHSWCAHITQGYTDITPFFSHYMFIGT
jgi:hypothetical protein